VQELAAKHVDACIPHTPTQTPTPSALAPSALAPSALVPSNTNTFGPCTFGPCAFGPPALLELDGGGALA